MALIFVVLYNHKLKAAKIFASTIEEFLFTRYVACTVDM